MDKNNKQAKRLAEYSCRLSARLEEHHIPYSDIATQTLTRKEYEQVLKYVNNHINYPIMDFDIEVEELEE